MNLHEERIKIFENNLTKLFNGYKIYMSAKPYETEKSDEEKIPFAVESGSSMIICTYNYSIPKNLLKNAMRKYAFDVNEEEVIALSDSSFLNNGKMGCLFADDRFYYTMPFVKPQKVYYADIEKIELTGRSADIVLKDGSVVPFVNSSIKCKGLQKFIKEINEFNATINKD